MFKYLLLTVLLSSCGYVRQELGGKDGKSIQGPAGRQGEIGLPGQPGHSPEMTVSILPSTSCDNGGVRVVLSIDGNLTAYESCNGLDGEPLPSQIVSVELINPCGDAPNIHDEVLMKFPDGTIVSSFSDNKEGKNTRFSILTPGNYMTTDGDNCLFMIGEDGHVASN